MVEETMGNVSDTIKTTVDELLKVLATDNVIGETMEIGDKVIIPITKVGLLFGTGAGMGSMQGQKGSGGGAGGGAGIEPLSVVVVFKNIEGPEGVQILSVAGMGPLSKIIADVGHAAKEMIEKEGGPSGMMKKGMKMKGKMGGKEEFKEPGSEM
ncbi:MAG TPA: spore germination protein GerW family protein [Methanobacterium sp.]|nr:spore germination protein GerW family protein [Methanobacterium sp.]